jgi:hypothetical protein
MGAMDDQIMFGDESTYNVPVTVSRTFEYDSESIEESEGRTEGDPLRVGSGYARADRFTPYFEGAAGTIEMAVLTKGFGYFLKHMMGASVTTGPAETTVYTHTGSEGNLYGKSFTCQVNRPFHPSGTNQPFTYAGGKVTEWTLSNAVDGNLMLSLNCDFASVDTSTALGTAGYPTSMDNFSWAGGVVTIGGSSYDITEYGLTVNNGYNTDRRFIRGNTDKKEPTASRREATFTINADFDSLTQRNRAHATSRAGALAAIVATWTGPTLLGTTLYPEFKVTIPAARFDAWKGSRSGTEAISQELSGVVRFDGTNSPLTVALKNADSTA